MKNLTTIAHDVVRVSSQFSFKNDAGTVTAVTFTGRRSAGSAVETFAVNMPTQGWHRKDGATTISNVAARWGWGRSVAPQSFTVFDFKPETIKFGTELCIWEHVS